MPRKSRTAAAPLPTEVPDEAALAAEAEEQARLEAEAEKQRLAARDKLLADMGQEFLKEFDEAKSFRLEAERRWIEDLRQFKGIYDPGTKTKLAQKNRSKLFLRLTRAKVKSLNARLGDLLFPAGDKNWTVESTPVPTLDASLYQAEIAQLQARDGVVDQEALKKAVDEVAKARARRMAKSIDDQLEEGSYEAECRKVIHSGNVFGTGVLKGPLGSPRMNKRWRRQGGSWVQTLVKEMKPYFSFVPIWYYYPDPLATDVKHARYEFEYKPMTNGGLRALKDDPAFMADRIDLVLSKFPNGDQNQLEQWEADLRQISREQDNRPNPIGRFRLLERWGKISGKLLAASGQFPDIDENEEYEGQVWMVGGIIIRADINPYDSGSRPFKLFYFDKDETSIWGEGIPSIMRDMQQGGNTALRALVDNAAMTAVPNLEVNVSLMEDEQDLNDFSAGRVWHRRGKGVDSQYPAVRVLDIPDKTDKFMAVLKLFMELGDEVSTVPRYTYGINDGAAVSKTVGGMSMFMGQANISLKDIAKNWDDGITAPFIGDMYGWNMQFNEDEDIKGDYDVIARGASSLVAKEIRANALSQFTADLIKLAPEYAKVRELFAERARNLDLDPDIFLKTQEEMEQDNQEKQMAEAAIQTVMALSKAMGIPPEQLVSNVDQVIGQMSEMMKTLTGTDGATADEGAAMGLAA